MRAVYALYDDGSAAQRAVNSLRAAGVGDAEITVITAQPMEEFEFLFSSNKLCQAACVESVETALYGSYSHCRPGLDPP